MDLNFKAIRLRALGVVVNPDRDYSIRKILRWYSKTFSTPLREVEELPLEDVIQVYYEEKYEAMEDMELYQERADLLITKEERFKRILQEEADEAEMFLMGKLIAAREANQKKAQAPAPGNIAEVQHAQQPIQALGDAKPPIGPMPEELPPGISMTFVSEEDMEIDLDGYGTMSQPEKP